MLVYEALVDTNTEDNEPTCYIKLCNGRNGYFLYTYVLQRLQRLRLRIIIFALSYNNTYALSEINICGFIVSILLRFALS